MKSEKKREYADGRERDKTLPQWLLGWKRAQRTRNVGGVKNLEKAIKQILPSLEEGKKGTNTDL